MKRIQTTLPCTLKEFKEHLNHQANSEEELSVLPKEDKTEFELQDLELNYNYED